jgi:antitoxin MazE
MKSRLVSIGNSRGVRLPKPLIEEAGLSEEVDLEVRGNTIVIAASRAPRAGWADAAARLRKHGGDVIDAPTPPTRFDQREWRW